MYFSLVPDIKYDTKPINYPFSEADFVTAKNFFRRYTVSEDAFGYAKTICEKSPDSIAYVWCSSFRHN